MFYHWSKYKTVNTVTNHKFSANLQIIKINKIKEAEAGFGCFTQMKSPWNFKTVEFKNILQLIWSLKVPLLLPKLVPFSGISISLMFLGIKRKKKFSVKCQKQNRHEIFSQFDRKWDNRCKSSPLFLGCIYDICE